MDLINKTNEDLEELKKICEEQLHISPFIELLLDDIKKEIENRLEEYL